MKFQVSAFGEKLGSNSGILELMADLGEAMADMAKLPGSKRSSGSTADKLYMLGGGNPAAIPSVQTHWQRLVKDLLVDQSALNAALGNYDIPRGRPRFMKALAQQLKTHFGWPVTEENIAITPGSQSAFFSLFNMFAGRMLDGSRKRILLPLMPEYIGYADQGIETDLFLACRPKIHPLDTHRFKYGIDFATLQIPEDIAAIAVSRPTNPTGNVLTDDEIYQLAKLATERDIPLIIDNAYGAPFPNILFTEITPFWNDQIILTLSLSKLGLPGVRTGIVVAHPEIIQRLSGLNAVMNLANPNFGQELVSPLLESGELLKICRDEIRPFYRERRDLALAACDKSFDPGLPYSLHLCEGALFFWLWCKDFPITAADFYGRLKKRRVLVVPGHYFFFGLDQPWQHTHECIRINYSQDPEIVKEGLEIIAEEVRLAYL